jgi:hypothetical protein
MVTFLRVYLYWSVLWGFTVHPAIGLKSLAPSLLLGIDLLVMGVCAAYTAAHLLDNDVSALSRQIRWSSFTCAFLLAYGLAVTAAMGGSTLEAAKYLAVLIRPMLILIALAIHLRIAPRHEAGTLFHTLRSDLLLLVGAQLAVATLQKISPALGGEFIASLGETQSAAYALAEGDVSGTFANSIDLAYFLLAAYIVLTQQHWQQRLAPPLLLSSIFVFYSDATGSLAGEICLWVYVSYLWLRSLSRANRTLALTIGSVLGITAAYVNLSTIGPAFVDKVDNMLLSRLGLIFVSIPALYSTLPQRLLSGSGADFNAILTLLNNLPDVPLVFTYEDATSVINDVFWVALLLSIGAPVAFFFVYRMAQLFKAYIATSMGPQPTRDLVWAIWLAVLLAGLLNQILLIRPFALTLTLGLLPLAMAAPPQRYSASS